MGDPMTPSRRRHGLMVRLRTLRQRCCWCLHFSCSFLLSLSHHFIILIFLLIQTHYVRYSWTVQDVPRRERVYSRMSRCLSLSFKIACASKHRNKETIFFIYFVKFRISSIRVKSFIFIKSQNFMNSLVYR